MEELSEERMDEIIDDFYSWSGGDHPADVSEYKRQMYLDNCLYGDDETLVRQWFNQMVEEDDPLVGLNFTRVVLDHNAHRLTGTLKKYQQGMNKEIPIDEGSFWLVAGLGQFHQATPDQILQQSLDDTIILSKSELTEFVKDIKKRY